MDELFHVHVQERGVIVQFEYGKLELAAGKIQGVRGAAGAEKVHNFVAGALFREEHHVQAHVLEQQFVFRGQIGLVADTGHHSLGPQFFGQQGAGDVHALVHAGIHGDEKVCAGATGFPEGMDVGRLADDGGYVRLRGQFTDVRGIGVDDGDVIVVHGEHLGKMRSRSAGSFDDDLHVYVL